MQIAVKDSAVPPLQEKRLRKVSERTGKESRESLQAAQSKEKTQSQVYYEPHTVSVILVSVESLEHLWLLLLLARLILWSMNAVN